MSGKAELVEQIKALQRSDPQAKQTWWDYCDSRQGGVRDPNRHDESTLQEFLAGFRSGTLKAKPSSTPWAKGGKSPAAPAYGSYGAWPQETPWGWAPPAAAGQGGDLASLIKLGQKSSVQWKTAWQAYCSAYGGGINDPTRHEASYLTSFLDFAGGAASQMLQSSGVAVAAPPMPGVYAAAPMAGRKRPASETFADYGAPPMKMAAPGGVDADKEQLVARVKTLQRRDADTKQAWWTYCDEQHRGVRDPARHEKETLLQFLSTYE